MRKVSLRASLLTYRFKGIQPFRKGCDGNLRKNIPHTDAHQVTDILRTLFACWEGVELDDAVLRLSASLKLALLLEEQGELYEARDVLAKARAAVER